MTRQELLRHIGSVEQIGGVKDMTYNDGKAKGVRAIEVNTGILRFTVLPDRCMDLAQADYRGEALSWISKTGITAPAFYEKDGTSWLRGFYGGLLTTCGLQNIGGAYGDQGLHGRIANTPAAKVSVFADWAGDDYVMRVSGEMRESVVFGENLVLKRTISTKLFSNEIEISDTVVNEGFEPCPMALCYHCNFGYPLVCEGARIVNVPEEIAALSAPVCGMEESCIGVEATEEQPVFGIENERIGAYLSYNRATLPAFLIWKMLGESEYVIGLEPRTTNLGGSEIAEKNAYVMLLPFEEYQTQLRITVKEK